MSDALILNVRDLHAGYGRVPVLHGIDLAVTEGQIIGVLGHNGCLLYTSPSPRD